MLPISKLYLPITKYKKIKSGLGSGKVITDPDGRSNISGQKHFLFFVSARYCPLFFSFPQKPYYSYYFLTKTAASFCLPLFLSA